MSVEFEILYLKHMYNNNSIIASYN